MDTHRCLRVLLALVAIGFALPAMAQRTYAILSLVGDRIDIVQHAGTTGTSLDRSKRDRIALDDRLIDRAILAAADREIRHWEPQADPVMLLARDASIYETQKRMLEGDATPEALLAAVRPMLPAARVTHLLLFARERRLAAFQFLHNKIGSGMIDGPGFYVDSTLFNRSGATGERGLGFMAPYVYMQAFLIDLASGQIVKQKDLLDSQAYSAADSKSGNPWGALSHAQKIDILVRMARGEAIEAVDELLPSP